MSSNKTIAKNTLFLYCRMLLVMGVSLYTSRVILNILGVEDFGIYSLVGGLVMFFSFLNNVMTATTQRFINYEIGKSNIDAVNKVFSASVNIHLFIGLLILVLGETIGLWFLNFILKIPEERMLAANVVYQVSLIITLFNLLRIPFHAIIIAYERMSFYAYLGIVEVFGKLVIVLSLAYCIYDRLIMYIILLAILTFLINLFYLNYCRKHYRKQTRYKYNVNDNELIKKMGTFSGWSLVGNVALIGSNQGVSIILNLFFGVVINATMGIASQVNTAVYGFVSNFQMAFMPQITQSYAENDIEKHQKLVLQASKFSFFLLLIIAIPILLNTEYIFSIWLGTYPEHSVEFTQLIIVFSLIDALAGPFWMSANAIGNIKRYQIGISFFLLLNIPLSYFLLHLGYPPTSVICLKIVLNFLTYIFRLLYVNQKIRFKTGVTRRYFKNISLTVLTVSIISYLVQGYTLFESTFISLILESIIGLCVTTIIIFMMGINRDERSFVKMQLLRRLKKYRNA